MEAAVAALAAETADGGPALLIGAPWRDGGALRNAALLLDGGDVKAARFKHKLPDYGVFDESRVFRAAPPSGPVSFRGYRLGLLLCEDMWSPDVAETLSESGAELLVVLNGSPWERGKEDTRTALAAARVAETGLPLLYVNQVGGQDELVFDGASFVIGSDYKLRLMAPSWRPAIMESRWTVTEGGLASTAPPATSRQGRKDRRKHTRRSPRDCAIMSRRTGSPAPLSACRGASIRRSRRRWRSMRCRPGGCAASVCRRAIPPTTA